MNSLSLIAFDFYLFHKQKFVLKIALIFRMFSPPYCIYEPRHYVMRGPHPWGNYEHNGYSPSFVV